MGKMADRITSPQVRSRELRRERLRHRLVSILAPCYTNLLMVEQRPMSLMRITIMSRRDCHLCHAVARMAAQVQEDLAFTLTIVDVDHDEHCRQQYGDRVPVVLLDDRELLSGKVTGGELRKAIKKARWRNPISRILSRIKLALTRG